MLIILTGKQQTGKTRWLERLIREAGNKGIACKGIVSPGTWVEGDDGMLVKTGINAQLLPQNEKLPFAKWRDLVTEDEAHANQASQADNAKLGWRIYDEAIDRINDHFDVLSTEGLNPNDLLIVDELGALEFRHDGGFTSALKMLDSLPSTANAIVVVRPDLVQIAKERLAGESGEPLVFDASSDIDYLGMESLIKSFSSASDKS